MPSRDSTGRPLSGAALRRRRKETEEAPSVAPPPAALEATPAPPVHVDAVLVWSQTLAAQLAALTRAGQDPERTRLAGAVLQQLAKLKGPAADSETAVDVLDHYQDVHVDTGSDNPPVHPVGVALWAFRQMAQLLHEVVTAPHLDEGHVSARAKSLAQVGLVLPQRELRRVLDLVEPEEPGRRKG